MFFSISCKAVSCAALCSLYYSGRFEETGDEFVPFEHNVVSKYGPISRMAKAKLKATGPLQVTAAQVSIEQIDLVCC